MYPSPTFLKKITILSWLELGRYRSRGYLFDRSYKKITVARGCEYGSQVCGVLSGDSFFSYIKYI